MKSIYIIIFIIFIIIVISVIYSYIKIDITNYIIKDKKIDKDIKIIFLSDLHNRNITSKLVDIINNIKPDIILFGGDMINNDNRDYYNFLNLYNKIKNYKVYYTFGNHEELMTIEEKEEYFKLLNKTNIKLVNNSRLNITNNIELYGLDNDIETYLKFGKKGLNCEYITSKLGLVDENKYSILVAHNPLEFDSYIKYKANLVLSGHVHGGLARIPFVKGILSPDISFFPKYDSGEYKKNKTRMIVSRGLGFSKRIPLRLFNPAEVVVINLKRNM